MKLIIGKKIIAIPVPLEGLEDTFGDDTVKKLENYYNDDPKVLNQDALEEGGQPVTDDNLNQYLADENLDDEVAEEPISSEMVSPVEEVIPEEQEIPEEEMPSEENVQGVLDWAIKNRKVLKIDYKTQGGKRRGGIKLKREIGLARGALIHRVIEPHYIFRAGTGNMIVVTWDRSVRAIRAFIINNIMKYDILDRRPFKMKDRVLPVYEKGVMPMANINSSLKEVYSKLSKKGMTKDAAVVQEAIQSYQNFKTAQYVGVQGYWIRNRRCWDNCYRTKRTSKPSTPAQEVWNECWKEYLASINDDKSGWEKYASSVEGVPMNLRDVDIKEWNKLFAKKVEDKTKNGFSIAESIYATIEEENQRYLDNLIKSSSNLAGMASSLKESGDNEIYKNIVDVMPEIMKEAGFWSGVADVAQYAGGKIKDWFKSKFQSSDPKQPDQTVLDQIMAKLQEIASEASSIANNIRGSMKYKIKGGRVAITRGKKEIIAEDFKNPGYSNANYGGQYVGPTGNAPSTPVTENPVSQPKKGVPPEVVPAPSVQTQTPGQKDNKQIARAMPYIQQVQGLVRKIDDHLTWIASNSPKDDPDTKLVFDAAYFNLDRSRDNIVKLLGSNDIKMFSGVAAEMDNLAKASRLAMQKLQLVEENPQAALEEAKKMQPQIEQQNPADVLRSAVVPDASVNPNVAVSPNISQLSSNPKAMELVDKIKKMRATRLVNEMVSLFESSGVPFTTQNLNALMSGPAQPVATNAFNPKNKAAV